MNNMLFNNLVRALKVSKYKEVRKIIIKLMKVPAFICQPISKEDNDYEYKMEMKKILIRAFGTKLMDSEPEVRYEAYQKLINLNI